MAKTVLIVDDSPTIRGFAKLFLKPLAVEVIEAEDGKQALDLCRTTPPAVVVADVNMPGMDGLTFTRELRADGRPEVSKIPVLLLTGDKTEEVRQKGREAGANEFVEKPMKGPALIEAIKRYIG